MYKIGFSNNAVSETNMPYEPKWFFMQRTRFARGIIDIFKKVKTNIDSGTATFIQDAACAALLDEKHVEEFRESYKKKRDILIDLN